MSSYEAKLCFFNRDLSFWGCASGRMMNDADCLRKLTRS